MLTINIILYYIINNIDDRQQTSLSRLCMVSELGGGQTTIDTNFVATITYDRYYKPTIR